MTQKDGTSYEGFWENDQKEGKGTLIEKEPISGKVKRTGTFIGNNLHGTVRAKYDNQKDEIEETWVNGK
jgi:hypothetical protein